MAHIKITAETMTVGGKTTATLTAKKNDDREYVAVGQGYHGDKQEALYIALKELADVVRLRDVVEEIAEETDPQWISFG